ncbi:TfoX/Sxy family protein [Demequina oxidasica]|uniref:TfoX/Sxy family protein n=1 Tax=Demequina oxidasica TaxID=676199 RepID=UPI00078665A9|nr:TfoX/Sxy family protein [Demequina oxidasica]
MSTSPETIAYLLEQLEPLEASAKPMFGEYCLYFDDKVVGFVCDDTMLFSPTTASDGLPEAEAYPGSKMYRVVDADLLEDSQRLRDLVTATAALRPARKPRAKRPAKS